MAKNVTLQVRNKRTGVEREMSQNAYIHLKKNWDILGEVNEAGEVVPINPSLPQVSNTRVKKGAALPAAKASQKKSEKVEDDKDAPLLGDILTEEETQDEQPETDTTTGEGGEGAKVVELPPPPPQEIPDAGKSLFDAPEVPANQKPADKPKNQKSASTKRSQPRK